MYLSDEQRTYSSLRRPLSRPRVRSLLEQGSGEVNEDVLLADGNVFGVFDGATSLGGRRLTHGLTGGLLAATTAARSFQGGNGSLHLLAQQANRRIAEMQQEECGQQGRHTLWSTSCAVVRLEDNHLEYCQTGDALVVFLYHDGSHRVITPDVDIDRDTLQAWKEMAVAPGMKIHEVLADQIREVRLEMNVRYGVLNGEAEAVDFLRHGHESLAGVSDVLLFTDGLHLPRENPLADNDWQEFVDIYRQGGLSAVHNHVRQLQQQDPDCRRYPRFKTHDDIAALALSF